MLKIILKNKRFIFFTLSALLAIAPAQAMNWKKILFSMPSIASVSDIITESYRYLTERNCNSEILYIYKEKVDREIARYNLEKTISDDTLTIMAAQKCKCVKCADYNCWLFLILTKNNRVLLKELIANHGFDIKQFNDFISDPTHIEKCSYNCKKFFWWYQIEGRKGHTLSYWIDLESGIDAARNGNYDTDSAFWAGIYLWFAMGDDGWKNYEKEGFGSLDEALVWYCPKIGLLNHYENYSAQCDRATVSLNKRLFNSYLNEYKKNAFTLCRDYIKNPAAGGKKNLGYLIDCADVFEHKEIFAVLKNIQDQQSFREKILTLKNSNEFTDLIIE